VPEDKPEVLLVNRLYAGTIETLEREFTLHKLYAAQDPQALVDELAPRLRAIAGGKGCDADFLRQFPKLRIVANFGVGYDTVDTAYCAENGIAVTNTPDVLTDEVADTAIALTLMTAKQFAKGDRYVRAGEWARSGAMPLSRTVVGKHMGILGLGRIGQAIAERAEAHKMRVSYHGRTRKDVPYPYHDDLVTMARAVDVLMVVTPGGAETRHLVDREVLEALGPDGMLVNIARGSVVDEAALIDCLERGALGMAGLDVFEDEPRVPEALKQMTEWVVLLPHLGSATHQTRGAMGQLMVDNLKAFFAGQPLPSEVSETRGR